MSTSSSTVKTLMVWLAGHRKNQFNKVTIWTTYCFNARLKLQGSSFDNLRAKPSPTFIGRGTCPLSLTFKAKRPSWSLRKTRYGARRSTVLYTIGKKLVERQSEVPVGTSTEAISTSTRSARPKASPMLPQSCRAGGDAGLDVGRDLVLAEVPGASIMPRAGAHQRADRCHDVAFFTILAPIGADQRQVSRMISYRLLVRPHI